MSVFAGFVDAGFLHAAGARSLKAKRDETRLVALGVVEWFKQLRENGDDAISSVRNAEFLRAYWYDGAFRPDRKGYQKQSQYFDALATTAGVRLRLGNIAERAPSYEPHLRAALKQTARALDIGEQEFFEEFNKHWEFRPETKQKGVDTLIALDMVRFAGQKVFDTAVLISGDQDLAGAVQTTQDMGCRVVIATPYEYSVSKELKKLADAVIVLSQNDLKMMVDKRKPKAGSPRK